MGSVYSELSDMSDELVFNAPGIRAAASRLGSEKDVLDTSCSVFCETTSQIESAWDGGSALMAAEYFELLSSRFVKVVEGIDGFSVRLEKTADVVEETDHECAEQWGDSHEI